MGAGPTVDGGDGFGPVLAAAKERQRHNVQRTADVTVDEVVFIDAEHAAVWFSISADGRLLRNRHRGDALVVDGAWTMARSTFCSLMSTAGVPCPPTGT
jgi:hypothetical protein